VGEIVDINSGLINNLLQNGYLPVIAPLGVDDMGVVYNINADIAAGNIATSLNAVKLVYLTDVEGVKLESKLISHLSKSEVQKMISNKFISGGMIPKVNSALGALSLGVQKVHIIDGRVPHALLLEIFTSEGIGTELVNDY